MKWEAVSLTWPSATEVGQAPLIKFAEHIGVSDNQHLFGGARISLSYLFFALWRGCQGSLGAQNLEGQSPLLVSSFNFRPLGYVKIYTPLQRNALSGLSGGWGPLGAPNDHKGCEADCAERLKLIL